jgi:hypothetical protein
VPTCGIANSFFRRARPRHGKSTPNARKINQKSQGIPGMKSLSSPFAQVNKLDTLAWAPARGKHEQLYIVIINSLYSEVRLDRFREAHGNGQGSGLSGEAESRDTGLCFAPFTAAN